MDESPTGHEGRSFEIPPYALATDGDVTRYLIIDSKVADCSGWSVETWEAGRASVSQFELRTVWGEGASMNFMGWYGEPHKAWVAIVDHGARSSTLILPDGSRHTVF